MKIFSLSLLLLFVFLTGCSSSSLDPSVLNSSVEATIEAMPSETSFPTYTPYPTYSPFPSQTFVNPLPILGQFSDSVGPSILQVVSTLVAIYVALWAIHWSGKIKDLDIKVLKNLHFVVCVTYIILFPIFIKLNTIQFLIVSLVIASITVISLFMSRRIPYWRLQTSTSILKSLEKVQLTNAFFNLSINEIFLAVVRKEEDSEIKKMLSAAYGTILNSMIQDSFEIINETMFNATILICDFETQHFIVKASKNVTEEHLIDIVNKFMFYPETEKQNCLAGLAVARKKPVYYSKSIINDDPEVLDSFQELSGETQIHPFIICQPIVIGHPDDPSSLAIGSVNVTISDESYVKEMSDCLSIMYTIAEQIETLWYFEVMQDNLQYAKIDSEVAVGKEQHD